jgi:hypothetical protein
MLISFTKWFYKDALVYQNSNYQSCQDLCTHVEPDPESNITWEFLAESRVDHENVSTGWSTHSVYSVQISLKSTDGQDMTGIPFSSLKDWFICTEDNQMYP